MCKLVPGLLAYAVHFYPLPHGHKGLYTVELEQYTDLFVYYAATSPSLLARPENILSLIISALSAQSILVSLFAFPCHHKWPDRNYFVVYLNFINPYSAEQIVTDDIP